MTIRQVSKRHLFVLIAVLAVPLCSAQDNTTSSAAQTGKVIFAIGTENGSDGEFRSSGWVGKEEYVFDAATSTADDFPAELHVKGSYESFGVVRLRVVFTLDKSYERIILRLVRGGDETTVLVVDDEKTYYVTSTMLGSGEGFRAGAYNLDLGSMAEGKHWLDFSVAPEPKGNGTYQWDALRLFGS
jgi:hypothetical protein